MTFHRTPAEMAADASYMRSNVGESLSGHRLWLTQSDLDQLGPEPETDRKVDNDDPVAAAAAREKVRLWREWWARACRMFERRREEAYAHPAWLTEYSRLLAERRAAAPAERAVQEARWDEFDRLHPQRGLTAEEQAASTANWERRWELSRQYASVRKQDAADPRLPCILADMKECDRINDDYVTLSWSRPSYEAELAAQALKAA